MNPQVMHDYIIFPVLEAMKQYSAAEYNSPAARQLLLATSGQESHCGDYVKQVKGPALGPYQMEPATIQDLFTHFATGDKLVLVQRFLSEAEKASPGLIGLVGNFYYSTAVARMNYRRFSAPLPAFNDQEGMWNYYKKYWNSVAGAATKEDFDTNWERYVKPVDFSDPVKRVAPSTVVV